MLCPQPLCYSSNCVHWEVLSSVENDVVQPCVSHMPTQWLSIKYMSMYLGYSAHLCYMAMTMSKIGVWV